MIKQQRTSIDIINSFQVPVPESGSSLHALRRQQIIVEHALKLKAFREDIKASKAKTKFYVLLIQQVLQDQHGRHIASAPPTFPM